jgi:hypothetical protein
MCAATIIVSVKPVRQKATNAPISPVILVVFSDRVSGAVISKRMGISRPHLFKCVGYVCGRRHDVTKSTIGRISKRPENDVFPISSMLTPDSGEPSGLVRDEHPIRLGGVFHGWIIFDHQIRDLGGGLIS